MKEYIAVRHEEELTIEHELIRCKNCDCYIPFIKNSFDIQGMCMRMNQPTDGNYFCADGVKKDDND